MGQFPNEFGIPSGRQVSSGLAIAALVVAVLGLCVPGLGLVAIVLGVIAVMKASSSPETHGGKGFAIGGILIGLLATLIWLVATFLIMTGYRLGKPTIERTINMTQIATALQQYAADNGGWYPETAVDWDARLKQYNLDMTKIGTPDAPAGTKDAYVYVPGFKEPFNGGKIVVYENPAYLTEGMVPVLYADGRVDFMDVEQLKKLLKDAGRDNGAAAPAKP